MASRELLQEAAFELFLEQGYEHTTVAHIAQRAGVGRSTFFNHFDSKADVFWTELDDAVTVLETHLKHPDAAGLNASRSALLAAADTFGPDRVPFVLTQYDLIGSPEELQASAVARLARIATTIENTLHTGDLGAGRAAAAAFALVAASVAAARTWAGTGVERGPLTPYVRDATDPVFAGFTAS
ncbi:MAG TPA: TetR/AcrR family transcriptional regulator [Terrimesophilobacter sp.]|nr:TetR/AcrR family transcriptional regulator [Terrimesophilobacter sp.]